jgi:hypothetical protein
LGGSCNETRNGMWNIVVYISSHHVYHKFNLKII